LLQAGWVRQIKKMFQLRGHGCRRDDYPVIAGEEIIFRSVLIKAALLLGSVASVANHTVFFALIQTFHMPHAQRALSGDSRFGCGPIRNFSSTGEIWAAIVAHGLFPAGRCEEDSARSDCRRRNIRVDGRRYFEPCFAPA